MPWNGAQYRDRPLPLAADCVRSRGHGPYLRTGYHDWLLDGIVAIVIAVSLAATRFGLFRHALWTGTGLLGFEPFPSGRLSVFHLDCLLYNCAAVNFRKR